MSTLILRIFKYFFCGLGSLYYQSAYMQRDADFRLRLLRIVMPHYSNVLVYYHTHIGRVNRIINGQQRSHPKVAPMPKGVS